jgi:hypothetical protein
MKLLYHNLANAQQYLLACIIILCLQKINRNEFLLWFRIALINYGIVYYSNKKFIINSKFFPH